MNLYSEVKLNSSFPFYEIFNETIYKED